MRINVYSQELTKEVCLVEKRATDTGVAYYGVRLYLASPDCLHHTPEDDDRSAITFWVPHAESFAPAHLQRLFFDAAKLVAKIPLRDGTGSG